MTALGFLCLAVWTYLFCFHGAYWLSRPELPAAMPPDTPPVDVVIPARDEASTIESVVASLVAQDYAGEFRIFLVDDNSTDGTAGRAGTAANLVILQGRTKPADWSGKMWAVSQGVAAGTAPLVLLTDADIVHDPRHLASLAAKLLARSDGAAPPDLVSEMVRLNCTSLAERILVPAFVYFFQMLYPFSRVNDPHSSAAAAAGGTVLVRRAALERIGGIAAIKGALIDDVALARAVKASGGGLYLGHSGLAASIRPYPHFVDIWRMIARTAFTQLRYSAAMLVLTVLGLMLVWCVPVWLVAFGSGGERACGLAAFALAAASYLPTLRRYGRSSIGALALPPIALFYMAATVASAFDHWRGAGARWKNRSYGSG